MTPPTWWVRVATLTLVAVTFVGCDWGMNPPPCQCPHFQEAVDSINWAPEAELRDPLSGSSRGDALYVNRTFAGDRDPAAVLDRIRVGGVQSGLELTRDEGNLIEMSMAPITVEANTTSTGVAIRVIFDGEDSPEVAELLEPIRVALEGA